MHPILLAARALWITRLRHAQGKRQRRRWQQGLMKRGKFSKPRVARGCRRKLEGVAKFLIVATANDSTDAIHAKKQTQKSGWSTSTKCSGDTKKAKIVSKYGHKIAPRIQRLHNAIIGRRERPAYVV